MEILCGLYIFLRARVISNTLDSMDGIDIATIGLEDLRTRVVRLHDLASVFCYLL